MTAIDSERRMGEARRLAEHGDLEAAAAILAEIAADESAADREEAALGLSVLAERMAERALEEGDPERAADVLRAALAVESVADRARLRVLLGIAHLELACREFAGALPDGGGGEGDAETGALAIELLARTLPLRGRDAAAAAVWRYGLGHPDPELAAQVRLRLGRDVRPMVEVGED